MTKSPNSIRTQIHKHCASTQAANLLQQQQLFYGPLIQDNPGEPVPETISHINPAIIALLLSRLLVSHKAANL